MSKLTSSALVQPSDLYLWTSTQGADLGAKAVTGDGREFVYVKAGGTALVAGKLQQGPAIEANAVAVAVSTQAIGDKVATVTISSSAITENQFVGGILAVTAGTGLGQTLRISGHNYGATVTSLVLQLEDAFAVATLTSDSKVSVLQNPYNGVIINPTTPTAKPVGVAISKIAASNYGWIQTKGLVPCLNNAGTTVGLSVAPSQAVAGAIKTGATTLDSIGSAAQAGVDQTYTVIDLRI